MTFVHPPYLLDFGKAYIDEPSPYTPAQLREWQRDWIRFFPKSDLPRVRKVLWLLKEHGIEYVDPKPWNIRLHKEGDEPPDTDQSYDDEFSEDE
ncbi:MAG TPA: hypothetical protein VHC22_33705 [Pirellulales bacterium]|nr:hypothetical protein [Pirellulales bacterium]